MSPSYLAQLRDAAIPGATVLDAILEAIPVTPGEARGYLARFLFRGDDVFKEVRTLSGGERSRLELALLGILPSNLMLLDEPTNHLDIAAREAIEAFLAESPATLLVVSHDRRLLETICEKLWVVDDGMAVPFDGGYRAWRAAVADGWTVQAEAKRRANRIRPGAVAPREHRQGRTVDERPRPGRGVPRAPTPAATGVAAQATAPAKVPAEGSPEALEGRVPPPPRGARPRARAARAAQEPARAVDRHAVRDRELRRDAPGLERARGRRAGAGRRRGRLARARGAGPVTDGEPRSRTVRIGITGPIGCGKSQVARWLGERGVHVVDADQEARAVTAPGGAVHDAVVRRWPEAAGPDGTLDRAALGRIVFADPAALRELEALVHPAVRPRVLARIAAAEAVDAPAIAIEAIKLVEGGLATECDEVWLVTCDADTQRERLTGRGTAATDADQRVAAQAGLTARLAPYATLILDTSGTASETEAIVDEALTDALAAPRRT